MGVGAVIPRWDARGSDGASSSSSGVANDAGFLPPEGGGSPEGEAALAYDDLPSGHPALRPRMETVFVSRDVEMDAEEERLRFTLLATTPAARHGVGLEAARAAILGLPGTADDGIVIRNFAPESFLIIFSSERPMAAALQAGRFAVGTAIFVFRRWTRLIRAHPATLYRKVTLAIEGVPAHA